MKNSASFNHLPRNTFLCISIIAMPIIAMPTFSLAAPAATPKTPAPKVEPLPPEQKKLHDELSKEIDSADKPGAFARIESLLKRGAPVNVPVPESQTFLMIATLVDSNMVALFLKHGADVKARDKDNWTALHIAAMMGDDPKIIELLAAAGADPNARAKDGDTPLMMSFNIETNAAVMRALIASGADVNVKDLSGTPLIVLAAALNRLEAIEVLVAAKVDVNAKDKDGLTALQAVQTLPLLASVAAGAEKRALTKEEQEARQRAKRIVEILKQAGAK